MRTEYRQLTPRETTVTSGFPACASLTRIITRKPLTETCASLTISLLNNLETERSTVRNRVESESETN